MKKEIKVVRVDGRFPTKMDEVGDLLNDGWRILDKTIVKERYINYTLTNQSDPDIGKCSNTPELTMKTTHERFDERFGKFPALRDGKLKLCNVDSRPIKTFIDQEIEKAVAEERKRIVEMIKENQEKRINGNGDGVDTIGDIINLITNK